MKKAISLVLSFIMISTFCAAAPQINSGGSLPLTDEFIQFMQPLYNDEVEHYKFFDNNGEDITQQVYNATKELARQEDWESIHNYVIDNVSLRQYEHEVMNARSNSKTKTVTCGAVVKGVSGGVDPWRYSIEVTWDMTATIYYDSNYKVTSWTSPTISNEKFNPYGQVKDRYVGANPSSSKDSVTFSSTIVPGQRSSYADEWARIYESASGSMTIYAR